MNVMRDELVGYNALIFDLQEHIKVLQGEMNKSETELESLILESKWYKITTSESSHKLLRLGMESTKLGYYINIYFSKLGDSTRDMQEVRENNQLFPLQADHFIGLCWCNSDVVLIMAPLGVEQKQGGWIYRWEKQAIYGHNIRGGDK